MCLRKQGIILYFFVSLLKRKKWTHPLQPPPAASVRLPPGQPPPLPPPPSPLRLPPPPPPARPRPQPAAGPIGPPRPGCTGWWPGSVPPATWARSPSGPPPPPGPLLAAAPPARTGRAAHTRCQTHTSPSPGAVEQIIKEQIDKNCQYFYLVLKLIDYNTSIYWSMFPFPWGCWANHQRTNK